jgi:putative phosphoserine phosphatase/1-acylglycerol-3-phosphate O-acyltransferase
VLNHQSQLDPFVVGYTLRTAVAPVAAEKVKHYPIVGPVARFIGTTFIDHSLPGQGRRAVESLVAEIESNMSVAIAPEGRASLTPQLLPFKKGAFHLAAQARVPVIPIVIRNAGEALWRSATFVRPGTIDVAILAPIDVSSWSSETLDQHIEQLRHRYLDTLTHWPQTPTRPKHKRWWAIWTTPQSSRTNTHTPNVLQLATAQSRNNTPECTPPKPRHEPLAPQREVDLDAEAV